MKQTNLTNVGGRIRHIRTKASLSMPELSKLVGVTSAYLGMVERGEKNPSEVLLQKIAQVTNSSFTWLESGQTDNTAAPVIVQEPGLPMPAPVPINIDISLFLSMVVQSTPNMTKEKLATMLGVSLETMVDILSGKDYEPAEHWGDYFSPLARQMDLPAVCQKIRDIDLFLQHENMEKKKKRLHDSLKRCAGPEYQYFIPASIQKKGGNGSFATEILYSEHIVLQRNESPRDGVWHFMFYQFADTADEAFIEGIMSDLLSWSFDGELTLVCENEKIFNQFLDILSKHCKDWEINDAGLIEKGEAHNTELPLVSLLLVDSDTWETKGEITRLGDWRFDDV